MTGGTLLPVVCALSLDGALRCEECVVSEARVITGVLGAATKGHGQRRGRDVAARALAAGDQQSALGGHSAYTVPGTSQHAAAMRLGATVPDFTAQTTHGPIRFYNWLGNSWCLLFSHPADFTPVCTTELARLAERAYEFTKRGVRMIGHSCDSLARHLVWMQDIRAFARNLPAEFPYPIIADETRELAVALDMLDESERGLDGEPVSVRAVLVIAPDRRLRLSMYYPNTTGRNVDEILRVIDSLMLTERLRVVTPVDWVMGDDLLVDTSTSATQLASSSRASVPENRVETVQMPSGLAYVRKTKFNYGSTPSSCEFWDT